jgi:hypothetical protein
MEGRASLKEGGEGGADICGTAGRGRPGGGPFQPAHHRGAVPHLQHNCHVDSAGLPPCKAGRPPPHALIP